MNTKKNTKNDECDGKYVSEWDESRCAGGRAEAAGQDESVGATKSLDVVHRRRKELRMSAHHRKNRFSKQLRRRNICQPSNYEYDD
jgi:hypothetical protein